jgi:hypothetical protein
VKISGYFEIGFCDNMPLNHGVEWEGFCAFQYALIDDDGNTSKDNCYHEINE